MALTPEEWIRQDQRDIDRTQLTSHNLAQALLNAPDARVWTYFGSNQIIGIVINKDEILLVNV